MALTAESYCQRLTLQNINGTNGGELQLMTTLLNIKSRRVRVFIKNRNETLFCEVMNGELLYL